MNNFNSKCVLQLLAKHIDAGDRIFAIYPFGENGRKVKYLLDDCFGIDNPILIDNQLCHFNNDIISYNQFTELSYKKAILIITIQNWEQNRIIYNQVRENTSEDRIINLFSAKDRFIENNAVGICASYNYIIPKQETFHDTDMRTIKVRIIYQSDSAWNSIKSLCEEYINDPKYELLVLVTGLWEIAQRQLAMEGMDSKDIREYSFQEDQPDILILTYLHENWNLGNCRDYTRLIIAPLAALIRYRGGTEPFIRLLYYSLEKYNPDYYICDTLLYSKLKDTYISNRLIEEGSIKLDGVYKACQKKEYPDAWSKLKNKRVVFWMVDHGIIDNGDYLSLPEGNSFDCYAREIFKYFALNEDIGLIFRAHPDFFREMLEAHLWSKKDIDDFRDYCANSTNIVWDECDTYDQAYSISDAVMTDAWCGTICSALPTLRPIAVLYRQSSEVLSYEPELTNHYYEVRNVGQLYEFLDDVVRNGNDPKYEERKLLSEKYIKHFDGKNALRIKKICEEKLKEKIEHDDRKG